MGPHQERPTAMTPTKNHRVLAIGAHPDDIEILCAGVLGLLKKAGCEIHIATMTRGDAGSMDLKPDEISAIRESEARASATLAGAAYRTLNFRDLSIYSDDQSNRRVTGMVRDVDPFLVITHPPHDYMVDHEATSHLVRNACFAATAPNYDCSQWSSKDRASAIPYLYYAHPIGGADIFGSPVPVGMYVDITDTSALKQKMLECHRSQREWLRRQHGLDDYVESMRNWDESLGRQATAIAGHPVRFAEAFRQHLGHAYPQENALSELLPGLVYSQLA